eukprot:TRINITY_DN6350_c0_g1_i1.p1 TRINITY_DN6350_c0_g1~~TRINITY_DN6350_c0_g1_i1.p1  ORF type:complete len:1038 (-),score=299.81 TRINITY_DN6350_c0_g1_i1:1075-3951(-)
MAWLDDCEQQALSELAALRALPADTGAGASVRTRITDTKLRARLEANSRVVLQNIGGGNADDVDEEDYDFLTPSADEHSPAATSGDNKEAEEKEENALAEPGTAQWDTMVERRLTDLDASLQQKLSAALWEQNCTTPKAKPKQQQQHQTPRVQTPRTQTPRTQTPRARTPKTLNQAQTTPRQSVSLQRPRSHAGDLTTPTASGKAFVEECLDSNLRLREALMRALDEERTRVQHDRGEALAFIDREQRRIQEAEEARKRAREQLQRKREEEEQRFQEMIQTRRRELEEATLRELERKKREWERQAKLEEERRRREEEEEQRRRKEEERRRKEEEEARRRADEQRAAEEARRRAAADEERSRALAQQRQEEERLLEEARKREEEKRLRQEEEERQRKQQQEEERKHKEEEERKRREEEERRRLEEEERKRKEEDERKCIEAERKRIEEEEERQRLDEEQRRRAAAEQRRRQQQLEEEERRRHEEAVRKRQREQEEAHRKRDEMQRMLLVQEQERPKRETPAAEGLDEDSAVGLIQAAWRGFKLRSTVQQIQAELKREFADVWDPITDEDFDMSFDFDLPDDLTELVPLSEEFEKAYQAMAIPELPDLSIGLPASLKRTLGAFHFSTSPPSPLPAAPPREQSPPLLPLPPRLPPTKKPPSRERTPERRRPESAQKPRTPASEVRSSAVVAPKEACASAVSPQPQRDRVRTPTKAAAESKGSVAAAAASLATVPEAVLRKSAESPRTSGRSAAVRDWVQQAASAGDPENQRGGTPKDLHKIADEWGFSDLGTAEAARKMWERYERMNHQRRGSGARGSSTPPTGAPLLPPAEPRHASDGRRRADIGGELRRPHSGGAASTLSSTTSSSVHTEPLPVIRTRPAAKAAPPLHRVLVDNFTRGTGLGQPPLLVGGVGVQPRQQHHHGSAALGQSGLQRHGAQPAPRQRQHPPSSPYWIQPQTTL